MAVRETIVFLLSALLLAATFGCGKMIVVGEVDAGDGTGGDSDTDADTDTETDSCSWGLLQVGIGLNGVWGTSAESVFAVGGGLYTNPIAYRYDGSDWDVLGGLDGLQIGLRDVWGTSDDDVRAVSHFTTLVRYDGSSWELSAVVFDALAGIWGTSSDNLFVVGGGLPDGLILWYHEGAWLQMGGAEGTWLNAVWGSAEDDVYAVGHQLMIHFGGVGVWSPVNLGSISLSGVTLENVWGSSSDDVYAVGEHWAGPVLLHFDGEQWQEITLGSIASGAELYGVHGTGPDDVWVVGAQGSSGIALHFDGEQWSEIDYSFPFPLFDVWVAPTGEVFTVGGNGAVYCTP
jgi:hypothetical protein